MCHSSLSSAPCCTTDDRTKEKSLAVFFSDIQDQCWALVLTPSDQTTHLIIADGYRRVQKVADLSQVLETFRLQLYPLTVRLLYRFVHQQTHFFNLGYCQGLAQDKKNANKLVRSVCQLTNSYGKRQERAQSVIPTELQP